MTNLEQAAKLFWLFDILLRRLGHTKLPRTVVVLWHSKTQGTVTLEIDCGCFG